MNVRGTIRGVLFGPLKGIGGVMPSPRSMTSVSNVLRVVREATNFLSLCSCILVIGWFRNDASAFVANFLYGRDYRETIRSTTRYSGYFSRFCSVLFYSPVAQGVVICSGFVCIVVTILRGARRLRGGRLCDVSVLARLYGVGGTLGETFLFCAGGKMR